MITDSRVSEVLCRESQKSAVAVVGFQILTSVGEVETNLKADNL